MVYTLGLQTIAATNTPQRLNGANGARVPATWILIQATQGNAGDLYVGGADPTSASTKQSSLANLATKNGIRLTAGSSVLLPVVSTTTPYDVHETWISGTLNDTFSVNYLTK